MKLNLGSVLVSVSINPQHEHINNWNFKYSWIRAAAALEGQCSMGVPGASPASSSSSWDGWEHHSCLLPCPTLGCLCRRIKQDKSNISSGLEKVSWAAQGNWGSSPGDQVFLHPEDLCSQHGGCGLDLCVWHPLCPCQSPNRDNLLINNNKSCYKDNPDTGKQKKKKIIEM